MNLIEHLRSVWRTFGAQRLRALLTLLGVIIGAGSIVLLASLLGGARVALTSLDQGLSDSATLRIREVEPPAAQLGKYVRPLSRADVEALGDALGVAVGSEVMREGLAHYAGREKRVRLTGGTAASAGLYRLGVARGRFLVDDDQRQGRRVMVIGHEVWTELLRSTPDVLGQQLVVEGVSWTVVGVLEPKPSAGHGTGTWKWDRRVLVPLRAYDVAFDPQHGVTSVFLRVPEGVGVSSRLVALGHRAERLLLRRHLGVKNFEVDDRRGGQQEELILTIVEILLLGTGLLSLLVGGINIMNIMLVTVTERTREIGIRRALGAPPRAIVRQFLVESATVSLVGGLLGVLGGAALAAGVSLALSQVFGAWPFELAPWSVALGLGLSLLTGVGFGLFPAWRAGRLDVVEALRAD